MSDEEIIDAKSREIKRLHSVCQAKDNLIFSVICRITNVIDNPGFIQDKPLPSYEEIVQLLTKIIN